MFKGYCIEKDGRYTTGVDLDSPKQAVDYCIGIMKLTYEVRVVDKYDCIVVQAKNGELIFLTNEQFD